MRAITRFHLCALLAVATAGCFDDKKLPPLPLEPALDGPNALSAYVTVSNPRAAAGERVALSVRALRGANVGVVGSFTLRLTYDAAGLELVEVARASKGMIASNTTTAGQIIAAGASAEGFTDDELMGATFIVRNGSALTTLQLGVTELNTVAFEDKRASMRVERGLYRGREAR